MISVKRELTLKEILNDNEEIFITGEQGDDCFIRPHTI
jgi:hypothetical protein